MKIGEKAEAPRPEKAHEPGSVTMEQMCHRKNRGPWSILGDSVETFGLERKDACRISVGHVPENLNVLQEKMNGLKKRFAAYMNPDYMFDVLFGKQMQ